MQLLEYNNIAAEIIAVKKNRNDCVEYLMKQYPSFSCDTFLSIYSQIYQRKIKKDHPKHHKRNNINKYLNQYHISCAKKDKEGFVSRLAYDIDFPPTLLARIILEESLKEKSQSTVSKACLSKYIKNPKEIPDKTLSREVEICIKNDQLCGPLVESIKREVGIKYEQLLHDILTEKGIAYYHEDVLRKEGYDKTPDFKLIVPILVNQHVIHWIESKALFGDEESHSSYLENQFWSYTNRFGPGLVIYWFGYIDELDVNLERGLMLKDKFPTDFITLESLLDDEFGKFNVVSY